MKFFDEEGFRTSLDQKKSLQNIFTNPYSYIWGAPGTGKTQFVLSYGVLHYLSANKRVAIFAPTNNSIEQVLRGLIKMTGKAKVNRNSILRLGTPSKKFAELVPEVCEEKGVQKKLQEIDKQISILERVIAYESAVSEIDKRFENLNLFDVLLTEIKKTSKAKLEFDESIKLRKKKEIDIK